MKFRDILAGNLTWGQNPMTMYPVARDLPAVKNKSPLTRWEWELDYLRRAGPAYPLVHDALYRVTPVTQTGEQP